MNSCLSQGHCINGNQEFTLFVCEYSVCLCLKTFSYPVRISAEGIMVAEQSMTLQHSTLTFTGLNRWSEKPNLINQLGSVLP